MYYGCPVDAQLMSVTASPGRTWLGVTGQCDLLFLASAVATSVCRDRSGRTWVPGRSDPSSSPGSAVLLYQDALLGQSGGKHCGFRWLDRSLDSLPVTLFG